MIIPQKKIQVLEEDVMDYYVLLVEKDMEILKRLKDAKNLEEMKEIARESLKLHEKMNKIAKQLGITE